MTKKIGNECLFGHCSFQMSVSGSQQDEKTSRQSLMSCFRLTVSLLCFGGDNIRANHLIYAISRYPAMPYMNWQQHPSVGSDKRIESGDKVLVEFSSLHATQALQSILPSDGRLPPSYVPACRILLVIEDRVRWAIDVNDMDDASGVGSSSNLTIRLSQRLIDLTVFKYSRLVGIAGIPQTRDIELWLVLKIIRIQYV